MPDLWMPGLRHDPGESAGYRGGKVRMQWMKHHDTAGRNSYQVCKDGRPGYGVSLCTVLAPKIGVPWQFCEFDALCADSGDWNPWGPSIEVERLGASQTGTGEKEPLTADQAYWIGRINGFAETWGIPNVPYRGPRFEAKDFYGHVSHYDIAYNPDGLTVAEWDLVTGEEDMTPEEHDALLTLKEWVLGGAVIPPADSLAAKIGETNGVLTGGDQFPPLEERIESEVRKIVAEELAKLPPGSAAGGPLTVTLSGTASPT